MQTYCQDIEVLPIVDATISDITLCTSPSSQVNLTTLFNTIANGDATNTTAGGIFTLGGGGTPAAGSLVSGNSLL